VGFLDHMALLSRRVSNLLKHWFYLAPCATWTIVEKSSKRRWPSLNRL
jgi:hypothetical protein